MEYICVVSAQIHYAGHVFGHEPELLLALAQQQLRFFANRNILYTNAYPSGWFAVFVNQSVACIEPPFVVGYQRAVFAVEYTAVFQHLFEAFVEGFGKRLAEHLAQCFAQHLVSWQKEIAVVLNPYAHMAAFFIELENEIVYG